LRGSLPGRQAEILRMWISYHGKEKIQKDSAVFERGKVHYRNLFLPISMGGMGVEAPSDFKFYVTKKDCIFATKYTQGKGKSTECRPLPGYDIEELTSFQMRPYCKLKIEDGPKTALSGHITGITCKRARHPICYYADNPSTRVVV